MVENSDPKALFPTKKPDKAEVSLGKLNEPLQKLWASMTELGTKLENEVAAFGDLVVTYRADTVTYGDEIDPTLVGKYQTDFNSKVDTIKELSDPYKIMWSLFEGLLNLDFGDLGTPNLVLGVRENFMVVGRMHDTRKDRHTPLDDFNNHWVNLQKVIHPPSGNAAISIFIGVPVDKVRAVDSSATKVTPTSQNEPPPAS